MTDKNHPNQWDELFQTTPPKADPSVKKAQIQAATDEFSKAFQQSARLSEKQAENTASVTHTLRRFLMNLTQDKMSYTAFGTLAVGAVAVSLLLYLPQDATEVFSFPADINTTETPVSKLEPLEEDAGKTLEQPVVAAADTPTPAPQAPLKELLTDDLVRSQTEATTVDAEEESLAEFRQDSTIMPNLALPKKEQQPSLAKTRETSRLRAESPELSQQSLGRGNFQKSGVAVVAEQSMSAPAASLDYLAPPAPTRPDLGEDYAEYQANEIIQVAEQPVSTFSVDVDTAAYSLVRNQLQAGFLPRPQAVRAEELINYFDYQYPMPKSSKQPFEPTVSVLDSPWNEGRKLLHIGIQGYDLSTDDQPDSNIVFLLDVSGSMNQANKLPLVKQSLGLLLDTLKPTDTVSIAVYAGAAGTVLQPTKVKDKQQILNALNNLQAGGSTAGGQGLRLAYSLAQQNFDADAVNRIILATDGDFNVGQSSNEDLKTLVERQRDNGVFLSVLGFGRNNYQDDMMQTLAQNGNGVAAYIDTLSEAKKVLVDEATSTLFPIAKDVKLQVEFNPTTVADYRLIGYETRALKREDFNNDKVDAGDIGAGHSVTAIYEITPRGSETQSVDPLRYDKQQASRASSESAAEYGFLKIRYKLPEESKSRLIEQAIKINNSPQNSETGFAVAVAGFAQLLSNSPHTGNLGYQDIIEQALAHKGEDEFGYRSEFIQLVRMAKVAQP